MTTEAPTNRNGARQILGLGALACIACCIGPILGLLGAIGVATTAGTLALGFAGSAVALLAVPVLRRRRRSACATTSAQEVAVAAPTPRRPELR